MLPIAKARAHMRELDASRRARRLWRIAIVTGLALGVHMSTAAAQLPNLADVSAQYDAPPVHLNDAQATDTQVMSYRLAINVPVALSPRRFLILGAGYQVDRLDYSQMPGTSGQTTFHVPSLSATFIQRMSDRYTLVTRAGVGLAGDFAAVDRGMIGYSTLALVTRSWSRELMVGGGAVMTGGFGKSLIPIPAISLRWLPTDNVRVDAFLPAFAEAKYTAWDRVEIGARLEVVGSAYAVRDARVAGRWPCAAQATDDPRTPDNETIARPGSCLDHVTNTLGSIGLVTGVRLTSTLWLTAFGGVTLYRHLADENASGDTLSGGTKWLPASAVFRSNLMWRIPQS